jgi:hypothetical protein
MIHESHYWKRPLVRTASWLERLRVTDKTMERDLARFECEVFIGFYTIRKLFDTFKVSSSLRKQRLSLKTFAAREKALIDYFNWHNVDRHYNLDSPTNESQDILFLCHQVVHSYVFMVVEKRNRHIDGFFLASDRMRHDKLYFVSLTDVVALFRQVGKDYPNHGQFERDPKTEQWREVEVGTKGSNDTKLTLARASTLVPFNEADLARECGHSLEVWDQRTRKR